MSFEGNYYEACKRISELADELAESEISNRAHVAELKSADAKIDALMLEYCPDEMTQEQRDRWAAHQVTASDRSAE
jgi:hypothetical protein